MVDNKELAGLLPEHEKRIAALEGYNLALATESHDLQTKLAAAARLISQVIRDHADPDSLTYNFCEDYPCQWCVEAQAAIAASTQMENTA